MLDWNNVLKTAMSLATMVWMAQEQTNAGSGKLFEKFVMSLIEREWLL